MTLIKFDPTVPTMVGQAAMTTMTGTDGTYSIAIGSLTAGKYTLRFGEAYEPPYRAENWNDKPLWSTPDYFDLNPSASLTGMNAALTRGPTIPIEAADSLATHAEQRESAIVVRVDQFCRGGRRFGKDAKPSEGIDPLIFGENACRNAGPANSVKPIAPGNEIAGQLIGVAILFISDLRGDVVEVARADIFHLEQNLTAGRNAGVGQILDHFMLGIDGDAFPAGQLLEVNAMAAPVEAQLNSVVNKAFALHPLTHTHLGEQVDRALFQHAGAHTLFHILPAAVLDYDGFDSLQVEELGKH